MRVRTTITLPDQLLQTARLAAVNQRIPLSMVIEKALEEKLLQKKEQKRIAEDPMKFIGVYKLGTKKIYTKRSELYDAHIRRKMGF